MILSLVKKSFRFIPTAILAFVMAIAVWISAVTAEDPNDVRVYPHPLPLEIIGQDPGLVVTSSLPSQVDLTLRAPSSIWNELGREETSVRAVVDLSGINPGEYSIPVQIQIAARPVKIVSCSPCIIDLKIESITTRSLPIIFTGNVTAAIGFQAENPVLSQTSGTLTGPESLVRKVVGLRASLNVSQASENIERTLDLQAVDSNGNELSGLTISPKTINVSQAITQRGGYRNVVVKAVLNGQIAGGYRITNIAVFPPVITVFSSDNKLVENLPGYVETTALDITGATTDQSVRVLLNLIPEISVVGDPFVEVQVGVATIEGSLTMERMPVEVTGVPDGVNVSISPESVDIILSGPLPSLDTLKPKDVRISIDLNNVGLGTYQRTPRVELSIPELRVESILPGSIEITLVSLLTPTIKP
jgi:YbbR domain-containing protein